MSALPRLSTSSSSDKISSHYSRVINSTQPQTPPSDFPSQELLNDSSASRSFGSRLTATIPPHDSPSFTTDNHQTWLPQPPSSRLSSPETQSDFRQPAQGDWVLYPSSQDTRSARPQAELPPATSRTAPSSSLGPTHRGQQHQSHRNPHFQRHHSVSSVQNPRVRNIIQGTGPKNLSTSPQRFSLTGHFYASSAPSSSSSLQQQRSSSVRPPVPLFHTVSTGKVHQQQQQILPNMFTSGNLEGSSEEQLTLTKSQRLIQRPIVDPTSEMPDFTDLVNDTRDHTPYYDFPFHSSSFENLDALGHTSEPLTVSPQELLLESVSAPPSATFTELSTPGCSPWESPMFANSSDTSPNYDIDDVGENFYTLFPENGSLDVNDAIPSPAIEDLNPNSAVAPAMSRTKSSSSQSPFSGRSSSQGRHSSIAGVNARKRSKPLPPVLPDNPNDSVSVKRARNTAAARKSRQKKTQMLEDLEGQVTELTNVNVHLQTENTQLKGEAARWRLLALARGHGDQL